MIDTITSQQDELCWRESCQAAVQGVVWGQQSAQRRCQSLLTLNISLGSTLDYGPEAVWSTKNVSRLPAAKCSNKGCGIPNTPYPGMFGCSSESNNFLDNAAYHQIPVAEEDISKTAFITKYWLYEFKIMPFSLNTAPQTHQLLWNWHCQDCSGQHV